jgi:hypothetical protein
MRVVSFLEDASPRALLSRSQRICTTAATMKCTHDACARALGKKNQALFTALIVANAATAFLVASGLRDMLPRAIGVIAAVLASVAAVCTGLALGFDYRGKAGRHGELATCYAAMALSCESDRDRYTEGRLDEATFDTILGCNVQILKELQLRSHGLESSCILPAALAVSERAQRGEAVASV